MIPADEPRERRLSAWQMTVVITLIAAVAVGLAAYAAAASYESVSALAAAKKVPLPQYTPAGIDGGLFGVILLDIVLTWLGMPLLRLRLAARLFAAGTITANAAAGWPDTAGVGLRIAAPALFVVLTEVARAVLLKRDHDSEARLPLIRWLLAPRQTWAIWKRQKLWADSQLPRAAVDAELAIVKLSARYGQEWSKQVPADLVWMICAGVDMEQALTRVAELTARPPEGEKSPPANPPRRNEHTSARKPPRRKTAASARNSKGTSAPEENATSGAKVPAPGVPDDLGTEAQALKILTEEPGISGSELGRRLGKTDRYGRDLMKRLAAAPSRGDDR